MKEHFFSIIVASYNAEATIRATILSVLKQKFEDYEIVVKDGGSTDGTLEKIPESEKIRVYSSRDGGIYQGMNEGIGYANGKYLCFLNCGDLFVDENVLSSVYETAKSLEGFNNIIYGNYSRKGVVFKQPSKIKAFYLYRTPLCHQTMFFGYENLESTNGYDTSYKILADYNHTVHSFKNGTSFVYCNAVICDYLGGGASESKKGIAIKTVEYEDIREKYFTKKQIRRFNIKLFLSFKGLRQRMISDKSPRWVRRLYRKLVNGVNR